MIITDQTEFDRLYWASKPPQLQPPLDQTKAFALATQGFQVDVPIMVYGWDPYLVMKMRLDFGYTWVPAALGAPIGTAPGLPSAPGVPPYDPLHPPVGAIKVSLESADYPPFNPPSPVPPPPTNDFVGIEEGSGSGFFAVTVAGRNAFTAKTIKDTDLYELDPRGQFVFHASESPFAIGNWTLWFTKA